MGLALGTPRRARSSVCGSQFGLTNMVIESDNVQNIRDHVLVGKPSPELQVKLSEI